MADAPTAIMLLCHRFRLESLAGSGGMGKVYRARDLQTGQTVAVKLLHATGRPELERFEREALLLKDLQHPGIVAYVDHGLSDDGQPYLAMEWLEGVDLSHRLADRGLSLSETLTLLRRVAGALAVAHERGVIHRDLKPSNLFLRNDDVERVLVLDFGIARRAARSQVLTRTGFIVGTPEYMAPEQARGQRELGPAADVFSLGCIFFECLTGQPPFIGEHVVAVLAKILFEAPPALRTLRPELPDSLDALLQKMLAKDPGQRLPDAAAVVRELSAARGLSEQPSPGQRRNGPASPLTGAEQTLVSVLMAAPVLAVGHQETLDAAAAARQSAQLTTLGSEVSDFGAHVEVLADGSLVASFSPGRGAATDMAAQAARAALHVRERWPDAAVALSTGRGELTDHVPIGEALDRAARLLRLQAPATEPILLDELTAGLLDARFRTQRTPGGELALHGVELEADETRLLLGKPTPCIGRDSELGMLEAMLTACIEESAARAVLITAPPGGGKSRLRHEFLRRVTARATPVLLLSGRGDPMRTSSSYGLLGQAIRRESGCHDGEDAAAQRHKLRVRSGRHLRPETADAISEFLDELCGLPSRENGSARLRAAYQDPRLMAEQIGLSFLSFLRVECAAQPVVILLEDLHWGDALTARLVEVALRELTDQPLLVLGLCRPEATELIQSQWGGVQLLPLRPLSQKASERLVRQALGPQTPSSIITRIVEQAAGNALFLEELIRAAAEDRGKDLPGTVMAMLVFRLGRLDPAARRLLRAASVYGESFWPGGVHAILGAAPTNDDSEGWLRVLVQEELVEPRRGSRFAPEPEYRFRHALMRDAAYSLLSEEELRRAHQAALVYLERMGEQDARLLAEHATRARELERAAAYLHAAAQRAFDSCQLEDSLGLARRGLELAPHASFRASLLAIVAMDYHFLGDMQQCVAVGQEALALQTPGSPDWCRLAGYVLNAAGMIQRIDIIMSLMPAALAVEPTPDNRVAFVEMAIVAGMVLGMAGSRMVSGLLTRCKEALSPVWEKELRARGAIFLAESLTVDVLEPRPFYALDCATRSIADYEAAGDSRGAGFARAAQAISRSAIGESAAAEQTLLQILKEWEPRKEPLLTNSARMYLLIVLTKRGEPRHAEAVSRLAAELLDAAGGNVLYAGLAEYGLANVALWAGKLEAATEIGRRCVDLLAMVPAYQACAYESLCRILLARGLHSEAHEVAKAGQQFLINLGSCGSHELGLWSSIAEAYLAAGDHDAACHALKVAREQLFLRAAQAPDDSSRQRYVDMPQHARLQSLAHQHLASDVT